MTIQRTKMLSVKHWAKTLKIQTDPIVETNLNQKSYYQTQKTKKKSNLNKRKRFLKKTKRSNQMRMMRRNTTA